MFPYLSIVIPVYNVGAYLSKCLESILSQNCQDWEVILVEDGSTDATAAICDEYAARDKRIRVIHKDNGGVSTARNLGLDNASGEWVWFVDGDDWIASGAVETLRNTTERYFCDLVIFGIEYYNEDLEIVGYETRKLLTAQPKDKVIADGDYPPQNYIVKRSIIENNHLRFSPGVPMGEDLEFQYKCLMMSENPISVTDNLYRYLRREGSAVRNDRSRINLANSSVVVMEHLVRFIIEHRIVENRWLAVRMNRVFKNVLSSNVLIGRYDREIHHRYCVSYKMLRNNGYNTFVDLALRAGRMNMRLYSIIIMLRKLIKG